MILLPAPGARRETPTGSCGPGGRRSGALAPGGLDPEAVVVGGAEEAGAVVAEHAGRRRKSTAGPLRATASLSVWVSAGVIVASRELEISSVPHSIHR